MIQALVAGLDNTLSFCVIDSFRLQLRFAKLFPARSNRLGKRDRYDIWLRDSQAIGQTPDLM